MRLVPSLAELPCLSPRHHHLLLQMLPANESDDTVLADIIHCLRANSHRLQESGKVDGLLTTIDESSSSSYVESCRNAIDKETDLLRYASQALEKLASDRIAALNRKRNTLASVNKLPNEILSEIFTFLARSADDPVTHGGYMLAITGVSARWRQVALGAPRLWCLIDQSLPNELRKQMISRSKKAPLEVSHTAASTGGWLEEGMFSSSIHRHHQADTTKQFLSDMAVHTERWRTLTLRTQTLLKELAEEYLLKPAPLLEELVLEPGWDLKSSVEYRESYPNEPLPEKIFSGCTPRLRRITLKGVYIPWTSKIYSGLTALELSNHEPHCRPTTRQFFALLSSSPNLTSLRLWNSGIPDFSSPDHVAPESPIISLPRLRDLRIIHSPVRDTGFLLSSIEAQQLVNLVVQPGYQGFVGPMWPTLFQRTPERCSTIPTTFLNQISHLSFNYDQKCNGTWEYRGVNEEKTVSMSAVWITGSPFGSLGVSGECDLPALKDLTLCALKKSDMAGARGFLNRFPNISNLTLRSSTGLHQLLIWLGKPHGPNETVDASWPCPNLRSLHVYFSRPDYVKDLLNTAACRKSAGSNTPLSFQSVTINDVSQRIEDIRQHHQARIEEVFGKTSHVFSLVEANKTTQDVSRCCECPVCESRSDDGEDDGEEDDNGGGGVEHWAYYDGSENDSEPSDDEDYYDDHLFSFYYF